MTSDKFRRVSSVSYVEDNGLFYIRQGFNLLLAQNYKKVEPFQLPTL